MRRVFVCIVLLGPWADTLAQTTGSCAPAVGEAFLDVGNVRARILNNGGLFWRGSPHVYEVPKGEGNDAIYAGSFWVGGWVRDTLRIAATRYVNYEFWPGPLDALGNPPQDCMPYDLLSRIDREDMDEAALVGAAQAGSQNPNPHRFREELEAWPWQWGAPVVDGDGNPHNYDLAAGDRPEMLGDQMLWWVMNDAGNIHRSTDASPLGMEVRVSAFAFNTIGAVGNTTFYRYRLHYRGRALLDSAYVAMFLDTDLGNFADDYIASDTVLGIGYTYNADNDDEGHYGTAPPALGVTFLQSPLASLDGEGTARTSGDRRFVYSIGPFRMEPGEVEEVVVAIVWSRGNSNLDSVRKLREDVAYIQALAPFLLEPRIPTFKAPTKERSALGYHRNYPNPFSDRTTIHYSLALPEQVTLTVYDMLGRKVATLVDKEQAAGWHEVIFEAEGLVPGIYVYRLQVGYARATEIMAVVR